jgi:hypothetical protein
MRRLLVAGRTREVGTLKAFNNNHVKHERRLQRVLYQVGGGLGCGSALGSWLFHESRARGDLACDVVDVDH